jgi:hypothetical protein
VPGVPDPRIRNLTFNPDVLKLVFQQVADGGVQFTDSENGSGRRCNRWNLWNLWNLWNRWNPTFGTLWNPWNPWNPWNLRFQVRVVVKREAAHVRAADTESVISLS